MSGRRGAPRYGVYFLVLLGAVVLGLSVYIASRQDESVSDPAALDRRAAAIREDLGDLCSSFDFQVKEELEGGVVRPIHCKDNANGEIHLRLFVFTDEEAREVWESRSEGPASPNQDEEQVESGVDWVIISADDEVMELAAERLAR